MAAQLKEAGNAAFAAKDFAHAHELYSEAIALDERNAVLYANRSASSFGLGKYMDALRDAGRATQIDRGYAKGWSRLATAHEAANEFGSAVWAWERALSALPQENLTDAQRKQQAQYAASLEKARRRVTARAAQPFHGIVSNALTDKAPWQFAEEMLPELQAAGQAQFSSSAYVIYFANKEWQAGIEYMKKLKRVPFKGIPDALQVTGHMAGLASISNAVMRDMRVLRFEGNDWIDMYNEQVSFEVQNHRAPTSASLEAIKQLSLQRLKKEGWDSLRPALAVVVRGWIMSAVFSARLKDAPHMAIEKLKETLELLHWGRQIWRDVHTKDRGTFFQDTFIRGVKVIYLSILQEAYVDAVSADKLALLETLFNEAHGLIEEAENSLPPIGPELDPGFVSSFYIYPAAEAHAAAGYCFIEKAKPSENQAERTANYTLAAKHYTLAAQRLPVDEEKRCWYLHCAIAPLLSSGAPKKTIMDVVNLIRGTMPTMQRVWATSALAKQGRDTMIEIALQAAERA